MKTIFESVTDEALAATTGGYSRQTVTKWNDYYRSGDVKKLAPYQRSFELDGRFPLIRNLFF